MSNRLRLGLDLDGTLADHTRAKLAIARELGYELSPEQTASEVMRGIFADEDYKTMQQRLYSEFAHTSPKTEGVREALAV